MKNLGVITSMLVVISSGFADEPPRRVVGYFTEWSVYDRRFNVNDIHGDKLTHVNYAFAQIKNGECVLFDSYAAIEKKYPSDKEGELSGNFRQLQLLKKKHPHLKTLISVGGWSLSGPFSDVAATEESRKKFTRSCVAFMSKYGFDGIDLDWEYPVGGGLEGNKVRPEDKQNYTLLLLEIRTLLDDLERKVSRVDKNAKEKPHFLLTIAGPAGPKNIPNFDLAKMHQHLDWINIMAYDFAGGWSPTTYFNAALYPVKNDPSKDDLIRTSFNADAAVKAYLGAKVPPEKLVLGLPFYGRGWTGVRNINDGLFQPVGLNLPKGTWEAGVFDYKDLATRYVGKYKRIWHDEAKVPWLFDEKSGTMISYDDPESLRIKAEYVRRNNLGGVMCWELSADDREGSLLKALQRGLKGK
jgi:chitinase